MSELHYTYYESPIGLLKIGGTEQFIGELSFVDNQDQLTYGVPGITEIMHECTEQLIEYFHGSRQKFDVPVSQEGTEFQLRVWGELMEESSEADAPQAAKSVRANERCLRIE